MRLSFCRQRGSPHIAPTGFAGGVPSSLEAGAVRTWSTQGCILTSWALVSKASLHKQQYGPPQRLWRRAVTRNPPLWPLFLSCRAVYSWVLYWQNNKKGVCICFTLACLHVPGAINEAPTTPAGQRNLLQSMWALGGQFSLKNDSHRRRSGCSAFATDAETVLVDPAYTDIHFNFAFHGVSPYFCWPERENVGPQCLIILSWITFLYLGCYYYNAIETWRQSKKPFNMLGPCREENQYKWTKTTRIEHYM